MMNSPSKASGLNADAKAHLLGAHACFHGACAAMENNAPRTALIELDKVIAIAIEARKILLGQATTEEGK